MVDNGPSYAEMGVTKAEAFQADRRAVRPAFETKLSQTFKDVRPELQKAIIADPFSQETKSKMPGVEKAANMREILRAAIMAEPPGEYEKQFAALSREEQKAKLYEQIDVSARITTRVEKYVEEHLEKLNGMSDSEAYRTLSQIAFGTNESNQIDSLYAQSQRRGFRLGIANFLETRDILQKYGNEIAVNPKGLAQQLLQKQLNGEVEVERLPIGLVVYLDESDYNKIATDGNPTSRITLGTVLTINDDLPKELVGRVILMNKGGEKTEKRTKRQLHDIRRHEIKHVLYREFHSQQSELNFDDIPEAVGRCKTKVDFLALSGECLRDITDRAKDEIAAYMTDGTTNPDYGRIRFRSFSGIIQKISAELEERKDLAPADRQEIITSFESNRRASFEAIRRIRLVADNMYRRAEVGLIDKEKVIALVMNTPGTKIHHLAGYTDWTEADILSDRVIRQRDQDAERELRELFKVPDHHDKNWFADAKRVCGYFKNELPPQSLPLILQAIPAWGSKSWSVGWAREAFEIVKNHMIMHGVPARLDRSLEGTLDEIIRNEELSKQYGEIKKTAEYLRGFLH